MEKLHDRLLQFIKYKGVTVRSFEISSGLYNGAVGRVKNTMQDKSLVGIAKAFPELNIQWLQHGYGEMLLTDEEASQEIEYTRPRKCIKFYPNVNGTMGGVDFLSNPDATSVDMYIYRL